MPKVEVGIALKEMIRVLKPGGLLFVNLPSVDCASFGEGEKVGDGEFQQVESDGTKIVHSFFGDDEADTYFADLSILSKKKWKLSINHGWFDGMSMIEYTVQK